MRRILGFAALAALLALPVQSWAQLKPELGGTGKIISGLSDNDLIAATAATSVGYVKETPTGTCDGSSFLRYDTTQADGSRFACVVGSGSTAWDAIGDPTTGADIAMAELGQTLTWDTAAATGTFTPFSFIINDDGTSGTTTNVLVDVKRAATSGTQTWGTLLKIENLDTDGTVTTGIGFNAAAGLIGTGIDLSGSNITTAIALGSNSITVGGVTLSSAEMAALDGGITGSEITGGTIGGAVAVNIDQSTNGTFKMDVDAPGTVEGQLSWDSTNGRIVIGHTGAAITFYRTIIDEDAGASLLYNGSDTAFDLTNTPASCDNVAIDFNGFHLKKVAAAPTQTQYTCATATITLGLAPAAADIVQASYTY